MDRTEELMNLNSVEWEKFEEIKEWISLQGSILFVENRLENRLCNLLNEILIISKNS